MEVYIDDLVIESYNEWEVIQDIEEMFENLRKTNMKLNHKKCTFGVVEGMFLGHNISKDGIQACEEKPKVVMDIPSPHTVKEV